jgi:transglutaminase-like putative cysteine protease
MELDPMPPARLDSLTQTVGGETAIWQAVEAMKRGILEEAVSPAVRIFASQLVASCRPNDPTCRAARIFAFVKSRMRFVPDPFQVEALGLASYHLKLIQERGETYGDCDDGALLIGTLARAVGLPVRLAVASFRSDQKFHHVWAEVRVPNGWAELDPFRSERFNRKPSRLQVVPI